MLLINFIKRHLRELNIIVPSLDKLQSCLVEEFHLNFIQENILIKQRQGFKPCFFHESKGCINAVNILHKTYKPYTYVQLELVVMQYGFFVYWQCNQEQQGHEQRSFDCVKFRKVATTIQTHEMDCFSRAR